MRTARRHPGRLLTVAVTVAAAGLFAGPISIGGPVGPMPAGQVEEVIAGSDGAAARSPSGPVATLDPAQALARLDEQPGPTPAWLLTGYRWPLPRGRITQPFGPSRGASRLVDGVAWHDGIDLATFCGDRVVAAHAGTVLAAGRHYDEAMGWRGDLEPYFELLDRRGAWSELPIIVVIDDGNGYRSIYAHFGRIIVTAGQHVRAGQLLGYEGRTGVATGCHLHYGLFDPAEPTAWQVLPSLVKKYQLPSLQTARVDPLLVLPHRARRASIGTTPAAELPH